MGVTVSNEQRGTCKNGHPWTEENRIKDGKGGYRCRVCYQAGQSKAIERRKKRVDEAKVLERAKTGSLVSSPAVSDAANNPPPGYMWKDGKLVPDHEMTVDEIFGPGTAAAAGIKG